MKILILISLFILSGGKFISAQNKFNTPETQQKYKNSLVKNLNSEIKQWVDTLYLLKKPKAQRRWKREKIRNYFVKGVGFQPKSKRTPWSAAFISYILKKCGFEKFPFSQRHAKYIYQSSNDTLTRNYFELKNIATYKPQVGDLICNWRFSNKYPQSAEKKKLPVTFETAKTRTAYPAHCDCVLEKDSLNLYVVGGNLGPRNNKAVKTRSYNLKDGLIVPDSAKHYNSKLFYFIGAIQNKYLNNLRDN